MKPCPGCGKGGAAGAHDFDACKWQRIFGWSREQLIRDGADPATIEPIGGAITRGTERLGAWKGPAKPELVAKTPRS